MFDKKDKFSPKNIANRSRLKGLQKLRWYCQICEKQCRDENGFKCHCTSEGHQRMMRVFSDNPGKFVGSYSSQFSSAFISMLRTRYPNKRVFANKAYQEYISFKEHVHMNGTRWSSLSGFVQWMGEKEICEIELTEKGWYITYNHENPELIELRLKFDKKEKMDLDDEARTQKRIADQVEKAHGKAVVVEESEEEKKAKEAAAELKRKEDDEKIKIGIQAAKMTFLKPVEGLKRAGVFGVSEEAEKQNEPKKRKGEDALKEIMEEQEEGKSHQNAVKDYWLSSGIVVKIIHKKLADGEFHKKKAIVNKVIDRYVGEVEIIGTGDVLRLDQQFLETVIPAIGKEVIIVNTGHRGMTATLKGPSKGKELTNVPYEHFSKMA